MKRLSKEEVQALLEQKQAEMLAMSHDERQAHIKDCAEHGLANWQAAMETEQAFNNIVDAEEWGDSQ